jgi:flagellar hook-length control protein FliK
VLNQTIENTVETKPEQVADEEPVVVVNDLRTSPKESNQTTIVEDAKAESVTGVENPLLSEDASKNSDSKNEFNGNKNNLFNKQTNVAPKEAPNTNTNVQTTFAVNAEATHIEITNASYQTTRVDVSSMIDKLVQTARVTLTDTSHTMEMILNPEELGKIFMSVTEKDGTIKARILAENETVKTALETQLVLLQDKFKANGMKIDSVEVSVGTHEFKEGQEESQALDMGMNNENNHSSNKEEENSQANLHRIDLNNLDGLQGLMSEEEKLTAQIMKDQGNTVSYQV